MYDELWLGVEFKQREAQFFFAQMGDIIASAYLGDTTRHPSHGNSTPRWQPDFYFYLDAFLGAARSIPDIIQKCFGWDNYSEDEWVEEPSVDEEFRRKKFREKIRDASDAFRRRPLSRVRVGTFHWRGLPSVEAIAEVFGGQGYSGTPSELIPSSAPRKFPEDIPSDLAAIFGKPHPVRPRWELFIVRIPHKDSTTETHPLFSECQAYLDSAQELIREAKGLCERVHQGSKLTMPLDARTK
jgi:hypothetical protein